MTEPPAGRRRRLSVVMQSYRGSWHEMAAERHHRLTDVSPNDKRGAAATVAAAPRS